MNEDIWTLLHTLPTGGTPHGITTALQYAYGCPRRVWYKKFGPEMVAPTKTIGKAKGRDVGTYGHLFLENHYKGQMKGVQPRIAVLANQFSQDPDTPLGYAQAYEAYQRYLRKFRRRDFGTILDVEANIELNDERFPLRPYTAKIDLVIRVTKTAQRRIFADRGVRVPIGVWLVDHKFLANPYPISVERYVYGLQAPAYLNAYNLSLKRRIKERRARGVLFNIISTTQSEFQLHFAETEGKNVPYRLQTLADRCNSLGWPVSEDRLPPCNEERCYDYNERCPYLQTLCDRV